MTDAITRPGETWHINGFNMAEVIVIRDGPDNAGHSYVDGRHQISIANFATMRDAACAVQGHNLLIEISALYQRHMSPHERDVMVQMALRRYGR